MGKFNFRLLTVGIPVLSVALLTLALLPFLSGTAQAVVYQEYNRPNPIMDYVPQEIGTYDGMYDNLLEDDCRHCHGTSTADRHHGTDIVVKYKLCTYCHLDPVTPTERDCLAIGCHGDDPLTPDLNEAYLNGWHHATDMAAAENCIACHDPNLIEEIGPFRDHQTYPPTVVTPTNLSCENCHWRQQHTSTGIPDPFNPDHPSTYDHYDDWGNFVGFYEYSKPIYNNHDTHHMGQQGFVVNACYKCHSQDPDFPDVPDWDPTDPERNRHCQICHSVETLHNIYPHVNPHAGWVAVGFHTGDPPDPDQTQAEPVNYRTGDDGTGTVPIYDRLGNDTGLDWGRVPLAYRQNPEFSADEQCWGCHGDNVPPYEGPPEDCLPVIMNNNLGMQPTHGSCGALVTLRGYCFGDFIDHDIDGNPVSRVILSDGITQKEVPIHAWTDTLIEWELPCWAFDPGNYGVRVYNEFGGSNWKVFTVEDTPTAYYICNKTLDPDCSEKSEIGTGGPCGSVLRIEGEPLANPPYGCGFDNQQSRMFGPPPYGPDDTYFGVHHVVDFVSSDGIKTATIYPSWSDCAIEVTVYNLFEDQEDTCGEPIDLRNFVQDDGSAVLSGVCATHVCPDEPTIPRCDCLSPGLYYVYVKAIYFGDEDGSGDLSCGDTIFEVEKSDPLEFELTNCPIIYKVNPRTIEPAHCNEGEDQIPGPDADDYYTRPTLKIYGANLGTRESGDAVYLGSGSKYVTCAPGQRRLVAIRLWSNTLIVGKMPLIPSTYLPKTYLVWVHKANADPLCDGDEVCTEGEGANSNYKYLRIIKPLNPCIP